MQTDPSVDEMDSYDDQQLQKLDWKNLIALNGRLLQLHGEGALGNEHFAKLPLVPILCIDQIERIDEKEMQASFRFPADPANWAYDPQESLEMLFQDQLDQLVGFWGCRKADGIGRALSSGNCVLHQSLNYVAGKSISFKMKKRKWIENKNGGGTAVFNGAIYDESGQLLLETKSVIVGILRPEDVHALRQQHGGKLGVDASSLEPLPANLQIPIYDSPIQYEDVIPSESVAKVTATQQIDQNLWPLRFHFRGDPVVPGNFGTHGMIALLKATAREHFGVANPAFKSLETKKFAGMIFEDPKQIRFELLHVTQNEQGQVVASEAHLYLETSAGQRMIETPIYSFKNLTVGG